MAYRKIGFVIKVINNSQKDTTTEVGTEGVLKIIPLLAISAVVCSVTVEKIHAAYYEMNRRLDSAPEGWEV